ncbi:xanthine dehydrogenase family protein subunit M [Yinghuangia aomiensis]|uniref:Xanthine dehydrogenase family protein subunit M n=1 Tax=Yinghuangia aomiensis TaxID=676205 RepID=A0ABP9I5S2_9ACTN
MKPASFDYLAPATVGETVALLAEHGDDASVLAGGQSLVPLMNLRLARPEIVVDINRVASLDRLAVEPETLRLGATVRLRTLERDPSVAAALPVLRATTRLVAHPQIRNRTTIGGSISHADPSSELPALLVAAGGTVELTGAGGTRRVAAADFFHSVFLTDRQPDELLTAVEFPIRDGFHYHVDEVARRDGDFPVAALIVGIRRNADGTVTGARAAAAGVADRPVRLPALERCLVAGGGPEDAADAAVEGLEPPSDLHASAAYRTSVVRLLTARIVRTLLPGTRGAAA